MSVADCNAIPADSLWYHKAVFLKADKLIALKKNGEVESIYRQQAERLFATDRMQELAQLLVGFSDELAEIPENEDSIPQDQSKMALSLLAEALQIDTGKTLREQILFKKIHLLRNQQNTSS